LLVFGVHAVDRVDEVVYDGTPLAVVWIVAAVPITTSELVELFVAALRQP
jgi:hypothetical protein